MAHDIATSRLGTPSLVYQGETPWHHLGVKLPSITDVHVAMTAANQDYLVSLLPLHWRQETVSGLGKMHKIDNCIAVVRDNDHGDQARYLGSVGAGYTVLQNTDAFALVGDMCAKYDCTIEVAGVLGQGEKAWQLLKFPQQLATDVKEDITNVYLLVTNGHTGLWTYSVRLTPIRVVCANTASLAMQDKAIYSLLHTKTIESRTKIVAQAMSRMVQAIAKTGETIQALYRRKMSATDLALYIDQVFPLKADDGKEAELFKQLADRRASVVRLVFEGKGSEMAGSNRAAQTTTAWAAYNAVTEYFDHVHAAEKKTEAARMRSAESSLWGLNAQIKALAWQKARLLAA